MENDVNQTKKKARENAANLGIQLSLLRKKFGITQKKLADAIGTQRSDISRMESGDYGGLTIERFLLIISKMAELTGVNSVIKDIQNKESFPTISMYPENITIEKVTSTDYENEEDLQMYEVTSNLDFWFQSSYQIIKKGLFEMSEDSYFRESTALNTLTMNARILSKETLDNKGNLYTPISLTLAALVYRLKKSIRIENWKAAIQNVLNLSYQLTSAKIELGVSVGNPTSIFRDYFNEAAGDAGILAKPTILNEENRIQALLMSTNWLLRFFIAYAIQCDKAKSGGKSVYDLAWIRTKLQAVTEINKG